MNQLSRGVLMELVAESESDDAFGDDQLLFCTEAKQKKYWMSEYMKRREALGEFHRLINELNEEKFKNYFRMTRVQFFELHDMISEDIKKRDTNFRKAVGSKERLAICLRYLATGNSYRTIAYSYRVSPRTVSRCVKDVCRSIWLRLQPQYMSYPTKEDFKNSANAFKKRWNFDHCMAAIDGKHVMIKAPSNSGSSFFNYKKTFSIVLMALVDATYKFLAIDVGAKGRFSDGGIFSSSAIGKRLQKGQNLPADAPLYDGGRPMPFVVVGDEAFPLMKHLMRPYPGRQASGNRRLENFNYRLSRARRIVENAFGILAARWRVYRTPFEIPAEVVDAVVKATCVLHNYLTENATDGSEDAADYAHGQLLDYGPGSAHSRRATFEAFSIRDSFMEYFNSPQGSVPWRQ